MLMSAVAMTKIVPADDGHLLQVAALVYRPHGEKIEFLLITSRGTGRWILPKGWPMPGRTSAQAALREAYEEAGVRGTAQTHAIGSYEYKKFDLPEGQNLFTVDVFPVLFSHQEKKWPEKQQRQFEWVSPEEAAKRVDETELKDLLLEFAPRELLLKQSA